MKKIYSKPTTQVYKLENSAPLLQASKLGGQNPFNWGNPFDDR